MRDATRKGTSTTRRRGAIAALAVGAVAALVASPAQAQAPGVEALPAPIYDIDVAPDGSILAAGGTAVHELRRGAVREVAQLDTGGSPVNGVAALGRGSVLAAVGGLDQADNASVWHVTRGGARQVADIEAFEVAEDPDALFGPRWKDVRCEEDPSQGFTAGPQSNPYHLTALTGGTALVADAAGNTLLAASRNGDVELVAVFTPPVDEDGQWRVLFSLEDGTDCYVQPVPTAVAVGPDGAMYVGELTGAPAEPGWSRVWRIEPGVRDVVCPSADCRVVVDGLTSVVDVAFGPDGDLYVAEMDENGWLAATVSGEAAGGTVNRCDVDTGACTVVADGLTLPGAIAFDKRGDLWVLENGLAAPEVHRLDIA